MTTPDATALARAVVEHLVGHGLREVVLCPGSRNAPLSFAVIDAQAAGALRVHTRSDERTAGFLALGLAKQSGAPVAVVTTSGTAVANLHPAVMEAAHAGVPLVALTADRPARLRGTSANQTTHQVGVFEPLVATWDIAAPADLGLLGDGAVHLNVQLDDPLVPPDRWQGPDTARGSLRPPRARVESRRVRLDLGPRTVVVAGDDAGPPARNLAEQAGWPLLAEPTSGARTGETAIRTYRLLLDSELAASIERVVVFGHPTLSRPVARLLALPDVTVASVPMPGVWAERPFAVDVTADAFEVDGPDNQAWLEQWRAADRSVGRQLDALLAAEPDLTPYAVTGAVSRALPPGGLLFVGASNPIRDLDLMVARYQVGARRKVVANRGLAGIDGTVSSAIGVELARRDSSRALALIGDVTFLHDLSGLVLGPGEARPDLTIVVVNDDGGSIFATLEQGAPQYADAFEQAFGTPHGVDLASACAATRTPHLMVTSLPELEHALASPNGGIEVIEARCRRDNRRELDERIRALRPDGQ